MTAGEPRGAEVFRMLGDALAGHYRLEREIGRGGMAIIYLAHDLRHDRRVAVKVLAPDRIAWGTERFEREIRIAARLTHPHILGVHDSGSVAGLLYYVMPYVEGESLYARIRRDGALPLPEALQLLRELADAVAHAHEHGVVHRDLKPENVLLSGGHAVVADFGIAKALAAATGADFSVGGTLTATGAALGTPAYMAPEQAVGDGSADHRADLYALGVIAYEVLTGEHPFRTRSAQAMVAAHLTEQPAPVLGRRAGIPRDVADVVMRMLSKDPALRPQTAREVQQALNSHAAAGSERRRSRRGFRLAAAAAIASIVLSVAIWVIARSSASRPVQDGIRTIAVLPFANMSGDPADEYFSDGLTDELAHALRRLPELTVAGRMSTYNFKGKSATPQAIGRSLGVSAIITGAVRRSGDQLRVGVELVSTLDGRVVWDSVYESLSDDVFAVQDEFSRATMSALASSLGGAPAIAATTVSRGTSSQEAYDLYLKGRYYWIERRAENLERSIAYFKQAIAVDPSFARAYAGLAQAYGVLGVYQAGNGDSLRSLLGRYAQQAVAIDSTIADGLVALASWHEGEDRYGEAEALYRAALRLEPFNPTVHHWYGFSLLSLGRTEEAITELRQAARLDPLSKSPAATYIAALVAARRLDEARPELQRVLAIDSLFPLTLWSVSGIQLLSGHADSAAATLEQIGRLYPGAPGWRAQLLLAYASAGRWEDAERIRGELERAGTDPTAVTERALAEVAWGHPDGLLDLLEQSEGRVAWNLTFGYLGCNPLLDPVRSDPRFSAAMRSAGIAECRPENQLRLAPLPNA